MGRECPRSRPQRRRARAGRWARRGDRAPDGDPVVLKPRYSAFDSTPLEILLRRLEVERLRLAGMATEMCVTQTAIAARELGFKVTVLPEACACVDERLERIALDYLRDVVGVRTEPSSSA